MGNYQNLSFILIINSNSLSKSFNIKERTNSIQARSEEPEFLNSNIASAASLSFQMVDSQVTCFGLGL